MKHIELSDAAAQELADLLDDGYYNTSPELDSLIPKLRGDDQRSPLDFDLDSM